MLDTGHDVLLVMWSVQYRQKLLDRNAVAGQERGCLEAKLQQCLVVFAVVDTYAAMLPNTRKFEAYVQHVQAFTACHTMVP